MSKPKAGDKRHGRSSITNGTKLIAGIDGRSAWARRQRDLIEALTDELGGDLSQSEQSLVKLAAMALVRSEQMQTRIADGEDVDDAEVVRLVNSGSRIIRDLQAAKLKRAKSGPSALEAWLAARETEDDADDTEADDTAE